MATNVTRALLIGIDTHLHAPPLRGCVNDVQLMGKVLEHVGGVAAANIRQLRNEAATRSEILRCLDELRGEATPDGTIVLHFSGWGVRIPKWPDQGRVMAPWAFTSSFRDRRSLNDEYESAIVPYDWSPEHPDSAISYGVILEWIKSLPSKRVIVLFDAPYSGTLLGGTALAHAVYIGAAAANEVCYEFFTPDGVAQGALTCFIVQAILRVPANATFSQVFRQAASELMSRFPLQHPVLEGDGEQPVFRMGAKQGTRQVVVAASDGASIVLNAGAACGLTVPSLWAIYPADTDEIVQRTVKLGLIELTEVRASDASARVVSEASEKAIVPGAVAVEEAHFYGEMQLRVAIDEVPPEAAEARELLGRALSGEDLLRLTAPGERPDITVRYVAAGVEVFVEEDAPRIFADPMWIVDDSQHRLALEPRPADARSSYDLRYDLQKLARHRNILGLSNPNLRSLLVGRVGLVLMRRGATGEWSIATADPGSGMSMFEEGDSVELSVRNDHDQPIYVSVLDFGLSLGIQPLPIESPIAPGLTAKFAASLRFPPRFSRAAGVETIKVFATVYPLDIRGLLFQDGARDSMSVGYEGSSTELWQLMDLALTGRGPRERRPVQLPPDQEWTTVEQVFELRRKEG